MNGPAPDEEALTRRQHEIVTHAAELFDRAGYASASMEEIAKSVGIRKPSLYHHFSNKDEILYWIHDEFISLLLSRHEHRLSSASLSPDQQLLEIQSDIIELMDTHRGHVRVFFENHREILDPERRQKIQKKRTTYQRHLQDIIEDGIETGVFRPIDARMAALAIFGMCYWCYQWYRSSGPYTPRQVAMSFWDLATNGLLAPTAEPDGIRHHRTTQRPTSVVDSGETPRPAGFGG